MLTVIVGRTQERVHPFATGETVLVGAAFKKFGNLPVDTLDLDGVVAAYFP